MEILDTAMVYSVLTTFLYKLNILGHREKHMCTHVSFRLLLNNLNGVPINLLLRLSNRDPSLFLAQCSRCVDVFCHQHSDEQISRFITGKEGKTRCFEILMDSC